MSSPPAQTGCPDAESLGMYVSGSLEEAYADHLLDHLDHCQACRGLVDQMSQRADSLVSALRHSIDQSSVSDGHDIGHLIARAQQYNPRASRSPHAERTTSGDETVSLDLFVECLSRSGLVHQSEIELLVEQISPEDTSSFAKALIERKKLTPLQARALLRGRWKGLILGNYVVLEKLGQGGMGQVFKARHRVMGRIVCLKVLQAAGRRSRQHLERFRREAKLVAAVDHPNIVVAHDADEVEGVPYLVMEFVEGHDLAKHVRQRGPLPLETAVKFILQAAQALAYAHARGIIHRDVKPHNLMLDNTGMVKVLDLGLARFELSADPDASQTSLTQSGTVMGSVDYIAPEQALNARDADYRSDIYSLGCTLHYLLTGRVPYGGETIVERLVAHREQPIPRLAAARREVPSQLDAIFRRMMAKKSADRYQSMTELVRDLEAFLNGEKPDAAMLPPTDPGSIPVIHKLEAVSESEPSGMRSPDTLPDLSGTTLSLAPMPAVRNLSDLRRKRTRPLPTRQLLWGVAAVLGVVLLSLLATLTRPLLFPAHPASLAGGGKGYALVAIAHNGFDQHDYDNITSQLRNRGIEFVTASTETGPAKSTKSKQVPVDISLAEAHAGDFDALFICGGNSYELKPHTNVFQATLDEGRVVAGIGDGWNALHDIWKPKKQDKWDYVGDGFEVQNISRGHLMKVYDCWKVEPAVAHVFTQLAKK